MKNIYSILFFLLINVILLSGCSNKFKDLVGKVYLYQDSVYTFTAAFDKDTLYYIMKDQGPPRFHKTPYKTKKINDSTFVLEVSNKPKFWEKDTWEIVVRNNNEFISGESGKPYYIYKATLDEVKRAFR